MEEEIWKDIPGYEELYQASDLGRIRSIVGNMNRRKRVLSPGKTIWGYYQVCLTDNEHICRHESVHKLVCLAFHPIPEEWRHLLGTHYLQVNHKDQNKTNNRADNLEWCTPSYNTRYGDSMERRQGTKNRTGARGAMVKIRQLSKSGEVIRVWNSMGEASTELGIFKSQICCCCKGTQKTAGGYRWEYADSKGTYSAVDSTRARMSQSCTRKKKVARCERNGTIIEVYDSVKAASRALHTTPTNIKACCIGKTSHAKGFVWKYIK